jgi:hypothetical protein
MCGVLARSRALSQLNGSPVTATYLLLCKGRAKNARSRSPAAFGILLCGNVRMWKGHASPSEEPGHVLQHQEGP